MSMMIKSGSYDGVQFSLESGLITFELPKHHADHIVEVLVQWIRKTNRDPGLEVLLHTIRAAHMAYQVKKTGILKNLDSTDVDLLYAADINEKTEWFFSIVNQLRTFIRRADYKLEMALDMVKSVDDVLSE